jgi:hypothetical protein
MHDWRALVRSAVPVLSSDPARNTEILDELAHHLADTYDALLESGLSDRDAFDRAIAELEATAAASAELRKSSNLRTRTQSPRTLGTLSTPSTLSTLSTCMTDFRFAVRILTRRPGFTFATVVTLALAIGATTAIFSVVQGVLLRPLPYREPDRLVRVWEVRPRGDSRNVVSAGNYLDWRDRSHSFQGIGAYSGTYEMVLTGDGDPLSVAVSRMTPSALAVLGVEPRAGRLFSDDEGKDGGPPAVLLSDALWRQRFGADPGVMGRIIILSGEPYTVVGVMRPEFRFPDADVDTWIAQQFGENDRAERRSHNYGVIARLKPGTSIDAAAAEMRTVAQQVAKLEAHSRSFERAHHSHRQPAAGCARDRGGSRSSRERPQAPTVIAATVTTGAATTAACSSAAERNGRFGSSRAFTSIANWRPSNGSGAMVRRVPSKRMA